MRAITHDRYGPPDVLRVACVDKPVPKDREVLIRVRAAEATKADCEIRGFRFSVKWFWLPMRLAVGVRKPRRCFLGVYFAGEIEALGRDVTRFAVGDRVFGATRLRASAYAEYLTLPEHYTVVEKPVNMSFAEAAAVPLGGLNALHFLRLAAIRPGESVLVNGAGGSIGAYAVQIAKAMGAEVTAVDAGRKEAGIRAFGADHFIDHTREDFFEKTNKYDVIFDMVPGSDYGACQRSLKRRGRYLAGNPRLSVMLRTVLTTRFTDRTARVAMARETRAELLALKDMIERNEIGSIVDTVYPMAQAAEAHRRVETEQRVGAIVLTMDDEA